jgi:small subunit ribosomal protein S2e
VRLIPAPRGSGIVASSVAKRLFALAEFEDVFTSSIGPPKTTSNFLIATYKAIVATFHILTPDQWTVAPPADHPFVAHNDVLAQGNETKVTKLSEPKRSRPFLYF